jgi:uncharacterized protein (TIRG00374 family)
MKWFKRAITLFAFCMLLYLFWPMVGQLRAAGGLFLHARWGWLFIALLLQFFSYAWLTGLNYLILRSFQGKISYWRIMAILPTIAFIEVAVPSAGASGIVLRARFLGKSGYNVEVSTFSVIMEGIYLAAALTLVSLSGFWYLLRTGALGTVQTVIVVILTVLLLGLGIFALWTGRDRERARKVMISLVNRWNRLAPRIRQKTYSEQEVSDRVDVFYKELANLRRKSPIPFLICSFSRVILDVATLGACFIAFRYIIPTGVLLTGYGLMLVLSGLAGLPGGLGLAEVSLAVIYARLGAPGSVAVAAAIAYRLIAFWLIRFIGFINWQILEARS